MARILVVDDDNAICQLFVNAFQRSGHETVVAHDGKEALERLKSEEFDAMVLDLKMPGMSGEIVLEKQESFSNVPIFIMTGYASIPTATKAVSTRNVVDYLEKHQADPIDVVQKIESYLAYYEFGDFALDNRSRQALYKGQPIEIGEAQMPLYELFLKRPDDFFTYQDLAREIEGQILELSDATNLMRNRIFRLRKKLEQIAGKEVIRSQAGIGFGWSYKARK